MKKWIPIFILVFFNLSISQLGYFDFEETGVPTGITQLTGTVNFDYTPAIYGNESLNGPSTSTTSIYCTYANQTTSYFAFCIKFTDTTPATNSTIYSIRYNTTVRTYLRVDTDGTITGLHGATTANTGLVMTSNTLYYIWGKNVSGSGADGVLELYISTTNTKPATPLINITNGAGTGVGNRSHFHTDDSPAFGYIVDEWTVSTTTLGDFDALPLTEEASSKFNGYGGFDGFKK